MNHLQLSTTAPTTCIFVLPIPPCPSRLPCMPCCCLPATPSPLYFTYPALTACFYHFLLLLRIAATTLSPYLPHFHLYAGVVAWDRTGGGPFSPSHVYFVSVVALTIVGRKEHLGFCPFLTQFRFSVGCCNFGWFIHVACPSMLHACICMYVWLC